MLSNLREILNNLPSTHLANHLYIHDGMLVSCRSVYLPPWSTESPLGVHECVGMSLLVGFDIRSNWQCRGFGGIGIWRTLALERATVDSIVQLSGSCRAVVGQLLFVQLFG